MASSQREAERAERKKSKSRKRWRIAWAIVGVVVAALLIMRIAETDFSSLSAKKNNSESVSEKNKYPYELSSGGDLSFGTMGSGLYVLDDSSFTVLDTSNASLVQTFNHGYSNPIVETAGSYSLLYDQGGTPYRLDTEKKNVYSDKSDNQLLCAGASESGSVVLCTTSDSAKSNVSVYNKSLKKKMSYDVANGYVIAAAIDARGTRVAFAAVNSENAKLKTVVYTMNIGDTEPRARFEYYSSPVLDLRFSSSDLFVVGSDFVSVVRGLKTETKIFEQGSAFTASYDYDSSDNLIYAYSEYSGSAENKIAVVKHNGNVKTVATVDSAVKDISGSSSYISVLTADSVITYKISDSSVKQTYKADDSYTSIKQVSSKVFAKRQTLVELISENRE